MAGSVNKVILIGNCGKEPEIRSTQDGREIANLSIATSESWKSKQTGERQTRTEWHRVTVYNEGLVRVIRDYVRKGSKLYVEGSLQTRKWQAQDGTDRYSTEVVLQNYNGTLTLLDSKKDAGGYGDDEPAAQSSGRDELDDEIPF